MILVKSLCGLGASELANLALKNRLYISGWQLSGLLKRIRACPRPDDVVSIAFTDDNMAVAVVILTGGSDTIACFTKKAYRKKGFGKAAVDGLRTCANKEILGHWYGGKGSPEFFQKCGLNISNWWTGS